MIEREAVLQRWRDQERLYLSGGSHRVYIADVISRYASPKDSILEIGCNAGSNLLALKARGYIRLAGLDVSGPAIARAQRRLRGCRFTEFIGDLADVIDGVIARGRMDVVFSVATLMHVHPDSEAAIQRIPELVGKYLITCEWESTANNYIEPRNYGDLFSKELEQVEFVKSVSAGAITGYTLRVFRRERAQ